MYKKYYTIVAFEIKHKINNILYLLLCIFKCAYSFRIELLLKGKGSGGMAPPFLTLGVDSDDDGKSPDKLGKLPIPTSIDSDDGKNFSCPDKKLSKSFFRSI